MHGMSRIMKSFFVTSTFAYMCIDETTGSVLDKEVVASISTLKRRASENVKSSISVSPEKAPRKGSVSPNQDVSFMAVCTSC